MTEDANMPMGAYEAYRICQTFDALLDSDSLMRSIASLVAKRHSPALSAFERYMAIALNDAGASEILATSPHYPVIVQPAPEERLVKLLSGNTPAGHRKALRPIEATLNRLGGAVDAIEAASARAYAKTGYAIGITWAGASFIAQAEGTRNSQVRLPEAGSMRYEDIGFFNELDWRVIDNIAGNAHRFFQASMLTNMHQTVMGTWAPDGSDWDVRTRMAASALCLALPFETEIDFDCDTGAQAVSATFTIPDETVFPQRLFDTRRGEFVRIERDGRLGEARTVYALRLAALLVATCFGSGRHIERAYVTGTGTRGGMPMVSCSFDRMRYVRGTLADIDAGKLSDPVLRFDAERTARLLSADELRFSRVGRCVGSAAIENAGDGHTASDTFKPIEPIDDGMAFQRIAPHLDERPLPEKMQKLFHAKRIRDIDARHYLGGNRDTVEDARADADESPMAAIANLERLADELERSVAPPDDDADSRPLYCANAYARAAMPLVEDRVTIGAQAQAYLDGDINGTGLPAEGMPRYFRAPDALFHAYMGLSDLYEQMGDVRGAELQADRCLQIAPTSAQAHYRKADILAQQHRFAEAANVLVEGLRCAISEKDCALLYYHLALVLWNLGMKRESASVHVYNSALHGEFAEKSLAAMKSIRKHADKQVVAFASPRAAAREMARSRIPISPSDEAKTLIIQAAIGLTCAHAPEAAAPYAAALTRYFRDDPVIAATVQSIIQGTKPHPHPNNPA